LIHNSHVQAITEKAKSIAIVKEKRDYDKLKIWQKFLKHNTLGEDIFREQHHHFNRLINEFTDPEDWLKEVIDVRVK
jgi:hypothetical protein